jgi:ABC-type Fe3+ transport system substrate-binding protein
MARRVVMADPTRGDASWYAAALFAALGEGRARALYRDAVANGARVVDGEDAVVEALVAGERPIALTDSNRAFAAQAKQPTLVVSVPDQDDGGLGAFLMPAVVGITQRGADKPASHALVAFLLSAPVARRIAMTADSILVLNDPTEVPAGPLSILSLRVMPVSYADLAARLQAVRDALRTMDRALGGAAPGQDGADARDAGLAARRAHS